MKRIIILFILLTIISERALAYTWEPQNNSIPKEYPQYLLVIRYWGSVYQSSGWVYLNETYQSLDEVIKRLNTYTSGGMNEKTAEHSLVGLWKLGEDANIVDSVLKLNKTHHEKEVIKEIEAWTDYEWGRR